MDLSTLPQRLAILAAVGAFGIVWLVGLICDVPIHCVSLRAVIAATVFWVVGLMGGKVLVNSICDAITRQLHDQENETDTLAGGKE